MNKLKKACEMSLNEEMEKMDKAITDNEIIKALECCKMFYAEHNNFHCNDCPINDCKECETKLFSNALDLINRQQAEIERLERLNGDLLKIADTRKKANFSLLVEITALKKSLRTAKADAIKECFAWVLSLFPCDKNFTQISRISVNRKLKEMVGENNVK